MGNTANRAYPYPANTDPLANMAAAIQALANALDTDAVFSPGAMVTANSFSVPNNVNTVVSWNTEVSDTDNIWDASAPTLFNIHKPGLYIVTAALGLQNASTTGERVLMLQKNGVEVARMAGVMSGGWEVPNLAKQLRLVNGDALRLLVLQSSGGAQNTLGPPFTSMEVSRIA